LQKKTITEIAKECNVSAMTIQRYLDQFGLIKKR
jgi:DNA-binding MurR/RpiR family transcriptional regulator